MRRGISLLEVLVAALIAVAVLIPLMNLFGSGIRDTSASIAEIAASNLAAEVADQLETVPFRVLRAAAGTGERLYSSKDGTLADRTALASTSWRFHLSPLPDGCRRQVRLRALDEDLVLAIVRVEWPLGGARTRTLSLRRLVARDSLFPSEGGATDGS